MTSKGEFKAAIDMMKSRNPSVFEDGFHIAIAHVDEWLDDLIAELRSLDSKQKWKLVEIIGYSRSPKAVDVLAEQLRSSEEGARRWAIYGLIKQKSKEADQILREARYYELDSPEATAELRRQLNESLGDEQPWEKYARTPPNLRSDD